MNPFAYFLALGLSALAPKAELASPPPVPVNYAVEVPATAEQTSTPTDYYVRHDGGPAGVADGKANVPCSDQTTAGQHCALGEVQFMYDDGSYNNTGWTDADWLRVSGFKGGDRLHIEGCSNNGSATDHTCRLGWRNADNSYDGATGRRWGIAGNSNASGMPPPPSGTAGQYTEILGANDGSCHAESARVKIHGGFGAGAVINLYGTNYVRLGCLDLSDWSACGKANQATGCTGSNNDFADTGLLLGASNLDIRDLATHGLAKHGIQGWTRGIATMDYIEVRGNGFDGWNADFSDHNTGSGDLTVKHFDISWNGFAEESPIVHALPYTDGTDDGSGGYGDGFGTATDPSNPGWHVKFDTGVSSYNTQDGLDALHVNGADSSMTILNVLAFGNMGQQTKIGGSKGIQINNTLQLNCNALRYPIPGTPPDAVQFTATTTARPTFTGTTSQGSNVITATSDISQLLVGDYVFNGYFYDGAPGSLGARVLSISGNSVTVSLNSAHDGSGPFNDASPTLTNVNVTAGALAVGQRISAPMQAYAGIPVTATITAISGSTITLNTGSIVSATGVSLHSAYNSGLADFCRAADGGLKITVSDFNTTKFDFNTVISANSTAIDIECDNGSCSSASTIDFQNNVLIGYLNNSAHGYPATYPNGDQYATGNAADFFYVGASGVDLLNAPGSTVRNNIFFNTRDSYLCTGTSPAPGICVDPLLADESWHQYGFGDFSLTSGSPARGAGAAISGITTDYNNYARATPPSMGALEYGSFPTTPPTTVGPIVTSQPSTQTVTAGSTATFTSAATGTPSPTVQWYKNGTAILGATSGSYTTTTLSTADSGSTFYALWSNGTSPSAQSNAATLTVVSQQSGPRPRARGNLKPSGNLIWQ